MAKLPSSYALSCPESQHPFHYQYKSPEYLTLMGIMDMSHSNSWVAGLANRRKGTRGSGCSFCYNLQGYSSLIYSRVQERDEAPSLSMLHALEALRSNQDLCLLFLCEYAAIRRIRKAHKSPTWLCTTTSTAHCAPCITQSLPVAMALPKIHPRCTSLPPPPDETILIHKSSRQRNQ